MAADVEADKTGMDAADDLPYDAAEELTRKVLTEGYPVNSRYHFISLRYLRQLKYMDQAQLERDIRSRYVLWIKPLGVTLGLGLPGLLLFSGSWQLEQLNAALGFPLGHYLGWCRLFMMLAGGFMIIIAWPITVPRDRPPGTPAGDADLDPPAPLKTRR